MSAGTITNLTTSAAHRYGNKTAITIPGGRSLGFSALDGAVARFAGGLMRLGAARGERIVLHLPNGIDWVVAYHAIARIGGIVVPVNILLTPNEIAFIAENSEAKFIIAGADRHAALRAAIANTASSKFVIVGDPTSDCPFEDLLLAHPIEPCNTSPEDIFTIAYTSGTTGKPKGAMLSHRAVFGAAATTATIHVRHSGDRTLNALPLPHVYGNVVMNGAFIAGYELFLMERFDPKLALSLIQSERITLFEGVPTMYYQMLSQDSLATIDVSALERCTVGGQTMPVAFIKEVEARFGCPLLELWGMTELAGTATSHSPYWLNRHGSIGLPFPGVEVRIADLHDSGDSAPHGVAGELCVRGPSVMSGYWNNPAATSAAIDKDGWFATGDIAIQDADGYLRIVDRRKDMIITAGYNVYPAELEQVIAMLPAVAMVAVGSVPDVEKGELAKAFVVKRPGAHCTEEEIVQHCRKHLAAYKVPRQVVFVHNLPMTSTGKIMRRALGRDALK